jgi:hypothetical protein
MCSVELGKTGHTDVFLGIVNIALYWGCEVELSNFEKMGKFMQRNVRIVKK